MRRPTLCLKPVVVYCVFPDLLMVKKCFTVAALVWSIFFNRTLTAKTTLQHLKQRQWCSGIIRDSHSREPGSIPGWRIIICYCYNGHLPLFTEQDLFETIICLWVPEICKNFIEYYCNDWLYVVPGGLVVL